MRTICFVCQYLCLRNICICSAYSSSKYSAISNTIVNEVILTAANSAPLNSWPQSLVQYAEIGQFIWHEKQFLLNLQQFVRLDYTVDVMQCKLLINECSSGIEVLYFPID